MRKKLIIYCFMTLILSNTLSVVTFASTDTVHTETVHSLNHEMRKDDIRYQYKVINNILYQRLYNFTTRKPVTDWEVVS